MHRTKISVISGSRAEFGQLLPLLSRIQSEKEFELDFVVTGSHLSNISGKTIQEIHSTEIKVSKCIEIDSITNNTKKGVALQISEVIRKFTDYFEETSPDLLVVIGDRYEMFGVGVAANTLLIPIVHICGGSTTSGASDEFYRHALTKMSMYHFTTCDEYRKRVIQLGEDPKRVFNVGSLAIENCLKMEIASEEELREYVGLNKEEKYCVVTFHPVTLENDTAAKEVHELIEAMQYFKEYAYVITLANADAGGNDINQIWKKTAENNPQFHVVSSLGMRRYLTALKYSEMMIGNSSSGTTEGPAMHIPTIDIGDRQKGRFFADSIIHCDIVKESIIDAIEKANTQDFRDMVREVDNPFGDGNTSLRMIEILKKISENHIDLKKDFYDVEFEVKDE